MYKCFVISLTQSLLSLYCRTRMQSMKALLLVIFSNESIKACLYLWDQCIPKHCILRFCFVINIDWYIYNYLNIYIFGVNNYFGKTKYIKNHKLFLLNIGLPSNRNWYLIYYKDVYTCFSCMHYTKYNVFMLRALHYNYLSNAFAW